MKDRRRMSLIHRFFARRSEAVQALPEDAAGRELKGDALEQAYRDLILENQLLVDSNQRLHQRIAQIEAGLSESPAAKQLIRAQRNALAERSRELRPQREQLSCGNLAHGFAACGKDDKDRIRLMESANIGIVTAYNDMLSAHQPFKDYPDRIKAAARAVGATAQVAGGVPAMCDGVTQGQTGMELSLFSRDVIALATVFCATTDW
mgnify:CR=1 FL=1